MNLIAEKTIRLRIADPDVDGILATHPMVRSAIAGKPFTLYQTVIYHDTPDWKFYKAGLTLSIHKIGESWEQRLFARNGKGWRRKVDSPEINLQKMTRLGKKLLSNVKYKTLAPVFRWEGVKSCWELRFPDGCRMNLTLERGDIAVGTTSEAVHEITLELKNGAWDRLFQTALSFAYSFRPSLEGLGVIERTFMRLQNQPMLPSSLAAIRVVSKATTEEMFSDVNIAFLHHLRHNQCVALMDTTSEDCIKPIFHALERMRFLLELFESVIAKEISSELDGELKTILDELEPVIRWQDFLTESLDPFSKYFPDYPTLGSLQQIAEQRRLEGMVRAKNVLSSFRFTRLVLGLGHWLSSRGWREMMEMRQKIHLDRTVSSFAREALDGYYRELRKVGKSILELSGDRFRQLCRLTDALATTGWFFGGLFGDRRKTEEFERHLATLRNILAARNQVEAADSHFSTLITDEQESAMHLFRGWQGKREEFHRQESEQAWNLFNQHRTFWH